jgi:Cyclic nucleotide-binding domain
MIKHYAEPLTPAAGQRHLYLEDFEGESIRVAERRYAAKDTLFAPGDPDGQLYFLLEGTVRLYKIYGGYKEATVALLKNGVCSANWALKRGPGRAPSPKRSPTSAWPWYANPP